MRYRKVQPKCLSCLDSGLDFKGEPCTFMRCAKGREKMVEAYVKYIEGSFACPAKKAAKQFVGMRVINDAGEEVGTVVSASWADGFLDVSIEMDEPLLYEQVASVRAQFNAKLK